MSRGCQALGRWEQLRLGADLGMLGAFFRSKPGGLLIQLEPKRLVLQVRPETDTAKRHALVERWYRQQVMEAATVLVEKWEPRLDVSVAKLFVQRMKTKWGSCNPIVGNIRLNSQLGMKPRECLEYIVVHEMAHLLEPTHNTQFQRILNKFMPNWRAVRDTLNQTPLAHVEWIDSEL